jgi:hypothetical protein
MFDGVSIDASLDVDLGDAIKDLKKLSRQDISVDVELDIDDNPLKAIAKQKIIIEATIDSKDFLSQVNQLSASIDSQIHHTVSYSTFKHDSTVVDAIKQSSKDLQKSVHEVVKSVYSLKPNFFQKILGLVSNAAASPFKLAGNIGRGFIENIFTGFTEQIGKTLSNDLSGTDTKNLGKYIQGKIGQFNNLLDNAFKELLGFPEGIKTAKGLAVKNLNTLIDNITDTEFYKDLEDLLVAFASADKGAFKKGNLTNAQEVDKRIFDEAREKVLERFSETIKEDVTRGLGAIITALAQPLRIRKRINLRDSAEKVISQEALFRAEYEEKLIKERIAQLEAFAIVVGGTAPNESKKGQPSVKTTFESADFFKTLFPSAFVDVVTPFDTVSIESLKTGFYNQILREKIVPLIERNKEMLSQYIEEEMLDNVINNLKNFHPVEGILQQNIDRGFNEDAIRGATKAIAALRAFDKPVTVAGMSGGGLL